MPVFLQLILIGIIGYLWGSIPAGYWMGKLLKGRNFDIRDYGSHKIGATNVQRTLGNVPAIIVFVFDLSKGVGPTLLGTHIPIFQGMTSPGPGFLWGPTVAGLAALIGHIFPVFIGFKGGRGVLTAAGGLLVISYLTFLIGVVVTPGTIAISRYVSLGSVMGGLTSIVCGIIFFFVGQANPGFFAKVNLAQLVYMVTAGAIIILFHYDNIGRLLAGTERKIGQKVKLEEKIEEKTSPTL
jgi:glycerol-3-phosphate acyltransferase PlsY